MTHRPTRTLAVLLATAGLLVGAACSEDPSTTSPTEVPPATEAPDGEAPDGGTDTTVPAVSDEPYVGPVGDLVGEALTHHVFTTLAGYVLEAGLLDTLRSEGPFTVFAPPDPAFQAIPLDALRAVQADLPTLTTVLTYHVLPGKFLAADLEPGEYETAAGIPLTITRQGDTILVNGSEVVLTDVEATNGVIHVVSDVLLPPDA